MSNRIEVSWGYFAAPIAKGSFILRTEPGRFTATGLDTALRITSKRWPVEAASVAVTGRESFLLRNRKLTANVTNYTVAVFGPDFRGRLARVDVSFAYLYHPRAPYKFLLAPLQTFTTTFFPASIRRTFRLKADAGSSTANFFPAELDAKLRLPAERVSYSFSYRDAGFYRGFVVKAEPRAFGSTANTGNVRVARKLVAEGVNLEVFDYPAAIRAGRGFTIQTELGQFMLEGQPAGVVRRYTLPVATAAFVETGRPVGLRAARRMTGDLRAVTADGREMKFKATRLIGMARGTFAATGQDVRLRVTASMIPATFGFFQVDGRLVNVRRGYRLPVAVGAFDEVGLNARLFQARRANVFPIMIGPG